MSDFSAPKTTVGTLTSVASSASAVTLLAANVSRGAATIYNESTAILFVALTSGVPSNTNYTVQVAPQGTYEISPAGASVYIGVVKGIWAAANGFARVTELV